MRILLYDWALDFLGGGQKYCCDMAAALQREHDVTLLSSKPVKKEFLEGSYGLDLSQVSLASLKSRPAIENLPSGLYSVLMRQWNAVREASEVSPLTAQYDLFINCEASRSMIKPLSAKSIQVCHFPPRVDLLSEWKSYSAVLKYTYALPYRALLRMFPLKNYAARYGAVITSSGFASRWIDKLWGVPGRVLYPAVDTAALGGSGNAILTVSRITSKKKIIEMLDVFKGLLGRGLKGWTFIIAGSSGDVGTPYLNEIKARSAGLPVRIVINPGFIELAGLYCGSRIYWHMTGLGVDPETEPYEMEHFGITPVEAMAHGLVPILFKGGGLRETVENGLNGFLVASPVELAQRTWELCGSAGLLAKLSDNALTRSRFFSREAFLAGLEEVINGSATHSAGVR